MSLSHRLLPIAIALVSASTPVAAESIAMLPLTGTDVPEEALRRFEESVHEGLKGAGYDVKGHTAFRDALTKSDFIEGCTFGPCMSTLGKVTGAKRALVVHVQALGSSYTFVASLVETGSGRLEAQVADTCAACSIDDAVATASMLGSGLLLKQQHEDSDGDGAELDSSKPANGHKRSGLRSTSYLFMAASVAAGAAGAYFLLDDDRDLGVPLVAGAGTGFVSGLTMFLFSRSF